MTPELDFESGGASLTSHWEEALCALHDSVFAHPPFAWAPDQSASHRATLATLRHDPTFGAVVAHTGSALAGFAYGHRLPADHGWWRDFPRELPAELRQEWDGRTFALITLAVDPPWRRAGVGSHLVDLLLEGRTEQRAVLSVQPAAVGAHRFYQACGWQWVGRKGPLPGVTPPCWDIYLRRITG